MFEEFWGPGGSPLELQVVIRWNFEGKVLAISGQNVYFVARQSGLKSVFRLRQSRRRP
jgi:hypothetical protein